MYKTIYSLPWLFVAAPETSLIISLQRNLLIRIPRLSNRPVKSALVNYTPWSLLKISR